MQAVLIVAILILTAIVVYMRSGQDGMYTGWMGYRLSDMTCHERAMNTIHHRLYHYVVFPDSVASAYLWAKYPAEDYVKLLQILKRKYWKSVEPPTADSAVIHVRVGDVVETASDEKWASLQSYSTQSFNLGKQATLGYYAERLESLRSQGVSTVTIVAGSHFKYKSYPRSYAFIDLVDAEARSMGMTVHRRIGGNPDRDVAFMTRAPYYVGPPGGFGAMVANLVKENGGVVL